MKPPDPSDPEVQAWLQAVGVSSLCQWDVQVFLERHPTSLVGSDYLARLLGYATELSLDVDRVHEDTRTHRYLQRIQDDFMGGVRSGVNGTPCFFINGVRHDGRWDLPNLSRALETAGRECVHAH